MLTRAAPQKKLWIEAAKIVNLVRVLTFLIALVLNPTQALPVCDFFPLAGPDPYLHYPGYSLHYLGHGSVGRVYRAVDTPRGRTKTVKVYEEFADAPAFTSSPNRDFDLKILKTLRADGAKKLTAFHVPLVRPVEVEIQQGPNRGRKLKSLEYNQTVVGKTVADFLEDPSVSEPQKKLVIEKYTRSIEALKKMLRQKYHAKEDPTGRKAMIQSAADSLVMQLPMIYMSVRVDEAVGYFSTTSVVKADGVIVHPQTLELYLIDVR